jgi:calcium/calmodulin-dependent protein kinase I
MEYAKKGNLLDIIKKEKSGMSEIKAFKYFIQVVNAVYYLHQNNIIHRDIKPENILFQNKDDLSSVILCDFGLAYQLNEYETSITGSCGTTIYMAPEILLKKNYDYLVDSFSAGIVLYILCSGGMHPFYKKGTSQKEYTDKILQQKCLCKFSPEMPLLARNLFLKLCKYESIFRYQAYKALNHPWITRSTKSQIPMTILEEYNKSDKINTFHALLSSVVSLVILKKYFKITKKKEENEKNNSCFEKFEKTSIKRHSIQTLLNMNNIQERLMLLSSMKKNSKTLFGDKVEEKRISPKKLSSVNNTGFNIKTMKNLNKKLEPPVLSKPNNFVKTGMSYNRSSKGNMEQRVSLKTQSFKDSDFQKEQQKNILKSKTHSKYKQMKSSSGNIVINDINTNKDIKDSSNTIQYSGSKKSCNNLMILNGSSKYNSLQNNKIFLKKHIVIESKNKNFINDTRKNNNSINSTNNKNNIEGVSNNDNNYLSNNGKGINLINNINLQIKNKNNPKEYNQISNYQNMFSGAKFRTKNLVLKEILNSNNDL